MCFLFRMGQLISRLFKRLSSGSATNNNNNTQNNADNQDEQRGQIAPSAAAASVSQDSCPKQRVQSIPVGQSIDSAEYTALAHANNPQMSRAGAGELTEETEAEVEREGDQAAGEKRVGVEEAVIKIQALVRGHLTRKALKDVNQCSSLGQSQFDHETLMNSQPAAVFELPNSPQQTASNIQVSARPNLESIAEQATPANAQEESGEQEQSCQVRPKSPANARKLALQQQSRTLSTPSKLEMPAPGSPGPSESGASIDLGGTPQLCSTPVSASVSIDILDHNIRPNEQMASVLHHKTTDDESQGEATEKLKVSVNGDEREGRDGPARDNHEADDGDFREHNGQTVTPPDCREQAAIRIQSAFRGYKTRKSSPYRKRSPSSGGATNEPEPASMQNGFNTTPQVRDANADLDADYLERPDSGLGCTTSRLGDESDDVDDSPPARAFDVGRRPSRTRDRSPPPTTTTTTATATNHLTSAQHDQQSPSGVQAALESSDIGDPFEDNAPMGAIQVDQQSLGSTDVLTVISNECKKGAESKEESRERENEDLSESGLASEAGAQEANQTATTGVLTNNNNNNNLDTWTSDSLASGASIELQDYATTTNQTTDDLTAALEPIPSMVSATPNFGGFSSGTDLSGPARDTRAETIGGGAALTLGSDTKAAAAAALTASGAGRRESNLSQDVITDSSLLGAALSLNETSQREDTLDADTDFMAEIEAEAERLVGELDSSISALNEVGKPGESLETSGVGELESDDIERRDPSGLKNQVEPAGPVGEAESPSRDRSRSPSSTSSSKSDKNNNNQDNPKQTDEQQQQKLQQMQNPKRTRSRNRNKRKGGKK